MAALPRTSSLTGSAPPPHESPWRPRARPRSTTPAVLERAGDDDAVGKPRMPATLAAVAPLTRPGPEGRVAALMASSSAPAAASPVRWPVAMTASAPENSRSRVSSARLRSAVMAWAPCLTWTSAKIATPPPRSPRDSASPGRRPLDEALVGDIGVGPLVDPDEHRARGLGDRQRRHGGIGQHVDAHGQAGGAPHALGHHRHHGSRLGPDGRPA